MAISPSLALLARAENAPAVTPATDRQGDPLPPGAGARIGSTRLRHGASITSLAYSPDGNRLTSTDGHSLAIWESRTGRCLSFRMLPPQITIWSPLVSPDGKLLACRLENGAFGVQETESGKVRCDLGCKDSKLHNLAFSKDNRWLVAADQEGNVMLWDVPTSKLSRKWKSPGKVAFWFRHAFTPDGKTLVHVPASENPLLWEVQTGKELLSIQATREDHGMICGLAISPDSKLLATLGTYPPRLGIWEMKTGRFLREVNTKDNSLGSIVFSPDGKQVVSTSESGEICCWEVETAKLTRKLKGAPEANAERLAFSADGKYLASGGSDNIIHVWDLATGKEMFPATNDLCGQVSARFLADGKTLLSHCTCETQRLAEEIDPRLRFWNLKGYALRKATIVPGNAHQLAISPEANTIALAEGTHFGSYCRPIPNSGLNSSIRLCDLATGKEQVRVKDLPCQITDLRFSPDGRFLFVYAFQAGPNPDDYHRQDVVQVWKRGSATSLEKIADHYASDFLASFFRAADSSWIGVPTKSGWEFYQCETGKLFRTCPGQLGDVRAATLSGRVLAFANEDKRSAAIVELATGKIICKLEGNPRYLSRPCFAISPDGRTVASDLNSETIILWDAFTGKQIGKLEGHRGDICSLCFSPDGRYLVSGSADTTILIWDYRRRISPPAAETNDLTPERLRELWQDLQASDADRGYRAVAALVLAPTQAVRLLQEKMRPASNARDDHYQSWIKDLDDERFETREKATAELSTVGELAEPVLRRALTKPISLETKARIRNLLEKMPLSLPSSDWLVTVRGLEILERIGTPQARELVEQLSKGLTESAQTREAVRSLERMKQRANAEPKQDPTK